MSDPTTEVLKVLDTLEGEVRELFARLQSQNQALQEERDKALTQWMASDAAWVEIVNEKNLALQALQERAEKAEADVRRWRMGVEEIASWEDEAPTRGEREFARLIHLSPTQETDPE